VSNDSAAPQLYLAFQGRCNYALVLFQPKQTNNQKSKEAPSKKNNSPSLLLPKRWRLAWLEEDGESVQPRGSRARGGACEASSACSWL